MILLPGLRGGGNDEREDECVIIRDGDDDSIGDVVDGVGNIVDGDGVGDIVDGIGDIATIMKKTRM